MILITDFLGHRLLCEEATLSIVFDTEGFAQATANYSWELIGRRLRACWLL